MKAWHRATVLLAALVLAGAGCSNLENLSYKTPPTTVHVDLGAGPTLPTNLSGVNQAGVQGVTTTTVPPIGPGHASLNGTVFGPGGPVPGATVEADRFVGDQYSSAHTTTAADGSWSIANILGGRYRVRAWQSPSLDLMAPQIVFVGSTSALAVPLQLTAFSGPNVGFALSPPDPQIKQMSNLVIQATNPTVGPDGVLRYPPDVGASVTLTNGPQWRVYNGNPQTTGSDGTALFQVTCETPGNDPLSAAVGSSAPVSLQVPPCLPPPPPPTTARPTTTTCPAPGGPPTTAPLLGTTTTTTLVFRGC